MSEDEDLDLADSDFEQDEEEAGVYYAERILEKRTGETVRSSP